MKFFKAISIVLFLFFLSCSGEPESPEGKFVEEAESTKDSLSLNYDSVSVKDYYRTDLSYVFDYKLKFQRMYNKDKTMGDSSVIRVSIIDKETKKELDEIFLSSMFYFEDVFENPEKYRSLITGKNQHFKIQDGDFGDLIIGDFNFDSKEDIAIINDSGGNAGPTYTYFLQTENKGFVADKFLTDSVVFFPVKMDIKSKSLITEVPSGACGFTKSTFLYNTQAKSWKRKSMKYVNICE